MTLIPFVLGHGPWLSRFADRCPLRHDHEVRTFDVLDPQSAPFFRLVNAANARAFGGMGMPAWVQLDCATLPTAMIGFALARHAAEEPLVAALLDQVRATFGTDAAVQCAALDIVPVAEFCGAFTPQPGRVVGFSLFTLVPGLALRTKAMALAMLGARTQTGIAQATSTAVRTHASIAPLRIVASQVPLHPLADTFVYELEVPATDTLASLARGQRRTAEPTGERLVLPRNDRAVAHRLLRERCLALGDACILSSRIEDDVVTLELKAAPRT